ncbi:hypothetical protein MCEMSEM23_02116 [Rhabdaerophilaceae bacterium]
MSQFRTSDPDYNSLKVRSTVLEQMKGVPKRLDEQFVEAPTYRGPERRRAPRSSIDPVRRGFKHTVLLQPESIPDAARMASSINADMVAFCRSALERDIPGYADVIVSLSRGRQLDRLVPEQDVAFMVATGQTANGGTHDSFFRIRRLSHDSPAGFLVGLFRALELLKADVKEIATDLTDAQLAQIADGLRLSIAAALNIDLMLPVLRWERGDAIATEQTSLHRWLRGHHIFAALTQGLVFGMRNIQSAYDQLDHVALIQNAELCTVLLTASARSFELTGDFPEGAYKESIRYAMEPPYQPVGFSGLLSLDHRELVSQMRSAKQALEHLGAVAPESRDAMMGALGQVYDSHKHVCARFVGTDRASLLMAKDVGRSAVEQIDRFKAMRMKAFGCPMSR